MSATDRQNRLLVAEDWRRIYQSFRNADFQSYDFENLRRVMIDYLRENFPEDFNDYIESSEYLALIDMIAFLGQSLAFRVDLNARENFLELAERRESILRLARTLSYNAKRNKPANGLLKWSSISTTENIFDVNGRNLAGQEIIWNDPANSDWYDQFIRVVNSALPSTNQFGDPLDKAVVYNIPTEQYRFQSASTVVPIYAYNKVVDGRTMNFEIVSTIIKDGESIAEDPPLLGKDLSFIYRDDGRGSASNNSGFFSHFRQGTLNTGTFNLTQPSTNEIVDINAININDTDVWLYKLDNQGLEVEYWQQIPNFESNNVIYNSLNKNIRNIYSVVTRTNDRVSLAFSDGIFGNLPIGDFKIYYRTSNGLTYTINPKDMRNVTIEFSYFSNSGQLEVVSITMGLVSSVSNSSSTESNDQIKTKAPATYYTQNRMITAEDYNISPLSVDQDIIKVKSVNRTSSGISRYYDLIDPTGKYSSISLFGDDGILYKEEFDDSIKFKFATTVDIEGVIYNQIIPILKETSIRNFYYNKFARITVSTDLNYRWVRKTSGTNYGTGYFIDFSNDIVGYDTTTLLRHLEVGCLLKFQAPAGKLFDKNNNNVLIDYDINQSKPANTGSYLWARVVNIINNGLSIELDNGDGSVYLNTNIPTNSLLTEVIPKWRTNLDTNTINIMVNLIFSNKPFGLRYDIETKTWKIIFENNLNTANIFNIGKSGDITNQKLDSSWLLLFTSDTEYYTVKSRNLRYIFESDKKIRFYYDGTNKIFDTKTNTIIKDKINILNINKLPNVNDQFSYDLPWEIVNEYTGSDGYIDTKKIEISFFDSNDDGVVDNPDLFEEIVEPFNNDQTYDTTKFIILEKYETSTGQYDYKYVFNNKVLIKNNLNDVSFVEKVDQQYFYFIESNSVAKWDNTLGRYVYNIDYKVFQGRDNLKFQYVHSADYETRIDPGQTNIMDIYILTKQYDVEFRKWLAGTIENEPLPPSSDSLSLLLSPSLNEIKAMSDEIIYHPVKYKILFGSKASLNLRAIFKLVKNPEQTISDNDIKSRVLVSINEFFSLDNWDFGDSFYFSELVTYIMNKTSPYLVNILIVPRSPELSFGSLFEIKSENNQIFINGATSEDIEIIDSITASSIMATGIINTVSNISSQQNIVSNLGSY
jgi:hypothetical protein